MADVQLSNARRIGFTALALVAFWVLAWKAYLIGWDSVSALLFLPGSWTDVVWEYVMPHRVLACGLLGGLIPFALLSLSRHNTPAKLRG